MVGSGKSGMAACRLLKSKGCEVCLTDSRVREMQDEKDLRWLDEHHVTQEFGMHHDATFTVADLIVVSPGVPLTISPLQKARDAGVPIIGELELGYHYFTGKIIAITGTNGKTTVTTMIGQSLQHSAQSVFVGGNIGTPFCDHVMAEKQAEIAVLEVSSFQLDSNLDFCPEVGLLLNISPDHLDRYVDYKAYGDSKMQLFAKQRERDIAILNATDVEVQKRRSRVGAKVIEFGDDTWLVEKKKKTLTWVLSAAEDEIYKLHRHQLSQPTLANCMAAICGARLIGATVDAVQKMLVDFVIPNHRLTSVGVWQDVEYIDDSKATNIGAVESALAGMTKPVILIAGGRDKGGDYSLLNAEVKRIVKKLILIGEAAPLMENAFAERTDVVLASSMDEAVASATGGAEPGDVVLLSPACASFDMFKSYGDRGNIFKEHVLHHVGAKQRTASHAMQRAV